MGSPVQLTPPSSRSVGASFPDLRPICPCWCNGASTLRQLIERVIGRLQNGIQVMALPTFVDLIGFMKTSIDNLKVASAIGEAKKW
jgi:hypothetical protein